MGNLLKHTLTEDGNETYCFSRIASAIAFLGLLVGITYDTIHTGNFQVTEYANAAMQILFGAGAAIGAKQITSKPYIPPYQNQPRTTTQIIQGIDEEK